MRPIIACPCCGAGVYAVIGPPEYHLDGTVTLTVFPRCVVCGDWSSCGTDAA